MFCVIQEIETKKISCGEPKEIEVYESSWSMNGEDYDSVTARNDLKGLLRRKATGKMGKLKNVKLWYVQYHITILLTMDSDEYDRCYDVFGKLRNPEYLDKIKREYKQRKEYETLKQFYRTLSKKFHPDADPDTDTSKQMQLLNKLKGEWGL